MGSCLLCLWCAGVPLLSLDNFHDGDWGMGLLSCCCCKSAKLLCPVLCPVAARGEEVPQLLCRALLLVSSSLWGLGVACSGLLAGQQVSDQLSSALDLHKSYCDIDLHWFWPLGE